MSFGSKKIRCGRFVIDYSNPVVMGILNVTPDSFSDAGKYYSYKNAISHAEKMINEGVDIIDIGAESTRPGSLPVPKDEELKRLLPVIRCLLKYDIPLSIDTYKPEVMQVVLDEGVDLINDVYGFCSSKAIDVVSSYNCALCVMHMKGDPFNMQDNILDVDIVSNVYNFFSRIINEFISKKISLDRVILDPGIGFGKTFYQNLTLIKKLEAFRYNSLPILVGLSRKSFIGSIIGHDPSDRLFGSISAMLASISHGANFVRVHDVAATRESIKVWQAINQSS
ncbi:dihydropteroate synthase [Candidatus Kinetoplastidibacterium crithidiae]|uniref:Dihydropteroate synthase n=1 Tax=Candidatus Kinetoplastidibacterium crithidiae TCC036E TaxID=1208918 RepID=M1LP32_9PROT|nr:dihydropteroate synthase [Candidatus Kinetoplastibacterium crithidii]AFZ83166.1 dihydropteroate synthase [Candidatus Kinetoplastibacterium crithidii (ex Angomonas deanei ATCC 30255)]AGF47442.1 dihydropteroate synthase [Candidatus Kinetoplastibacterium crithidii TCC036E]